MIHEKDKAKLKRAKERKKLKKQHEQQQQQQFNEVQSRTESRTSGERRSGSHTPQRSFDATPNSVSIISPVLYTVGSIGHILEHEFFCLGHLDCADSKEKQSGF